MIFFYDQVKILRSEIASQYSYTLNLINDATYLPEQEDEQDEDCSAGAGREYHHPPGHKVSLVVRSVRGHHLRYQLVRLDVHVVGLADVRQPRDARGDQRRKLYVAVADLKTRRFA